MEISSSALLDELPKEKNWKPNFDFYQWEGFWYLPNHLESAIAAKSHFQAQDDDFILASFPKTGSTWLKALIPSILNRNGDDQDDDSHDPLIKNHPNALMPSFEIKLFADNPNPDLSGMPSPRLFRTHVPYAMLSESVEKSGCKIVYIAREPKDTFVSLWHFMNTRQEYGLYPVNEAFDGFCKGVSFFGPFHEHVLGYWNESVKRSEKILFLKYEEMKRDTRGQVKKLASFLGKPFMKEEELDKILWSCSLERPKNLEVNRSGFDPWDQMAHSSYFRKGLVGDWKNNLSAEMKERLDEITRKKFEGSGLDL